MTGQSPELVAPANAVLRELPKDMLNLLQSEMEPVNLGRGDILKEPGMQASYLVFPASGVVSLEFGARGFQVGLIGPEGIVGISLLMGRPAFARAAVLFPGTGRRIARGPMLALLEASPSLRARLLGAIGDLMAQITSCALATGNGTIVQRVARWLLMVAERLETDEVPVVHETVATALCVRRAGITVALHRLEGMHLLRASRGRVHIYDRAGLSEMAGSFGDI